MSIVLDAFQQSHNGNALAGVDIVGPFDGSYGVRVFGDLELLTPQEARRLGCLLIEAAARVEHPNA